MWLEREYNTSRAYVISRNENNVQARNKRTMNVTFDTPESNMDSLVKVQFSSDQKVPMISEFLSKHEPNYYIN